MIPHDGFYFPTLKFWMVFNLPHQRRYQCIGWQCSGRPPGWCRRSPLFLFYIEFIKSIKCFLRPACTGHCVCSYVNMSVDFAAPPVIWLLSLDQYRMPVSAAQSCWTQVKCRQYRMPVSTAQSCWTQVKCRQLFRVPNVERYKNTEPGPSQPTT